MQARSVPAVTITAGTNNTGEVGIPMVFTLEPPAAATSNAIREAIVNFGDGTVRNIGSLLARTTIAYTYTRAGVYTVTVTATDVMNFTATSSVAVTINEAATVPITILATPARGGIVNFSASVTGSIGGGGASAPTSGDFGDGSGATTTGPSTSHRYLAAGTYVVRLRVVTTTGQEGFAEQTVRVTLLLTPAPRAVGPPITSRCRACRRAPSAPTRSSRRRRRARRSDWPGRPRPARPATSRPSRSSDPWESRARSRR